MNEKAPSEYISDGKTRAYDSGDWRVSSPIMGAGGMSYTAFMSIGEGGMARVLLAKARGPGGFEKLVVLKTIRRHALSNPNVRKLFVDEARLCAQLNHPNLVQVYDVDLDAESPCLIMEYLEGKSLHEILLAGSLPRIMLLTVCSEVLSGLHYAHELRDFSGELMNVVHRDVSPHNILVTYDGAAKVLDFGIAKMAGAVSDTATEEVKGKLSYMAPEQLMGSDVDRRADVFAVGVLLWEIAVGERLWNGVSEPTMMHRLATGELPPVPEDADVDPELVEIIERAMAPHAEDRYPTALALQLDLDTYLGAQGRRPPMRQVGETLGIYFEEDRERTASRIRLALKERETQAPPPGFPEDENEKKRRGLWVLAGAAALSLGVLLWILVFPSSSSPVEAASSPQVLELDEESSPSADNPLDQRNSNVPDAEGSPVAADGPDGEDAGDQEEDSDPNTESDQEGSSTNAPKKRMWPRPTTRAASAPSRTWQRTNSSPPVTPATEAAPSSAPTQAPAPTASCDPPFFYKDGIKTYRPECL